MGDLLASDAEVIHRDPRRLMPERLGDDDQRFVGLALFEPELIRERLAQRVRAVGAAVDADLMSPLLDPAARHLARNLEQNGVGVVGRHVRLGERHGFAHRLVDLGDRQRPRLLRPGGELSAGFALRRPEVADAQVEQVAHAQAGVDPDGEEQIFDPLLVRLEHRLDRLDVAAVADRVGRLRDRFSHGAPRVY